MPKAALSLPSGRRLLACYHEAGHCLARWYFGREFDRAVVLTTEEVRSRSVLHNRRGHPIIGAEGFMDAYDVISRSMTPSLVERIEGEPAMVANFRSQTRASVAVELVELYSGSVAEAHYRKTSLAAVILAGGDGDFLRVREVLTTWYPEPGERAAADALAERRAVALMRSSPGRAAVGAMAQHMHKHGELTWKDGSTYCEQAYGWPWAFRGNATDTDLPSLTAIRAGAEPPTPIKMVWS